jgi:uncharacterized protein involved in cysteine biosynthesis
MDVVKLFKRGIEVTKSDPVIIVPYLTVNIITLIIMVTFGAVILGSFGMAGMAGGFGAGSPADMMAGGGMAGASSLFMMGGMFFFIIIALLVSLLLVAMAIGGTVAMAFESVEAGKTSLNTGIQIVQKRFLDLIVTIILLGIIIGVGFIFLILPGAIAFFLLLLTFPALIIDNLGPAAALKRSYEVMTKNIGDGVILFIGIIAVLFVSTIINMIFGFIPVIGSLIALVIGAAFSAYLLVVQVLFYIEATKE